jgi:hypothetical protein
MGEDSLLLKENKELKEEELRGAHTSGIVIGTGGRKIALYTDGRRRAGENPDQLSKARGMEISLCFACPPRCR